MTTRVYKGFTITHLHGTMTFKVYDGDMLVACVSTLKAAKKVVNNLVA